MTKSTKNVLEDEKYSMKPTTTKTKKERNKEKRRKVGREIFEKIEQAGGHLDELDINLQLLAEAETVKVETENHKKEIKGKLSKVRGDLKEAKEKVRVREEMLNSCIDRIQDIDQLVYRSYQQKRLIAYLREEEGWSGSSSAHPQFHDMDEEETFEPNKQIPAKSNKQISAKGKRNKQLAGDPNMHFVESPALEPPQVQMDMVAQKQKQHKAKLVAAATPDDDAPLCSDFVKDEAGTSSGKGKGKAKAKTKACMCSISVAKTCECYKTKIDCSDACLCGGCKNRV